MENSFIQRFGKHSHRRNATEILSTNIPINKSIKPSQKYNDHDHLFQSFLNKKSKNLPKIDRSVNQSDSTLSDSSEIQSRYSYNSSPPLKYRNSDISSHNQGSFHAIRSHVPKRSLDSKEYQSLSPILNFRDSSLKNFRSDSPSLKSFTPTEGKYSNSSARISKGSRKSTAETSEKSIRYKPYIFKDYLNARPDNYYQLGGLGPSYIGNESWKSAIAKRERIEEYCRLIRESHKALAI